MSSALGDYVSALQVRLQRRRQQLHEGLRRGEAVAAAQDGVLEDVRRAGGIGDGRGEGDGKYFLLVIASE